MPRRRNFLKALTVGAVALGIGTVEAVKAVPVTDALTVDLAKIDPTMDEAQESGYALTQKLAKLRGTVVDLPEDSFITHRYLYVDPATIYPVWSDGQVSEILDASPDIVLNGRPYQLGAPKPPKIANTPEMQALSRRLLADQRELADRFFHDQTFEFILSKDT